MRRPLLLLTCLVAARAGDAPAPTPFHAEVAAAERAFARMAREKGTNAAFTAWLAPDSQVLRPQPDPGLAQYQGKPEDGSLLAWGPSHIEAARSGDLALSTGPWTYHPKAEGPAVAQGFFVSIWQRQADGSLKVLIDGGNPHPLPAGTADLSFAPPAANAPPPLDLESLKAAEKAFITASSTTGPASALQAAGAADLRLYRRGGLPKTDLKAALKDQPTTPLTGTWDLTTAGVSKAGDLGYTVGTLQGKGPGHSYFRVWRNVGGAWRLVVDLQLPLPVPAP